MNDKYLQKIAEIEDRDINDYIDIAEKPMSYEMLVASAIMFCFLEQIINVKNIAEEINEPADLVQKILNNLYESGYLLNNKIIFNYIKDPTDKEEWRREYCLFSLAGVGLVKKI